MDDIGKIFAHRDAVLFDLDGTVYYGDALIPGALESIDACRKAGLSVVFLTNNSTKTRSQILEKLRGMGVNCILDEIMTAGFAAASYAARMGLQDVLICGSDDLACEFRDMGVSLTADSQAARNLVIGYDACFDYAKLTCAVRVAMQADTIIACNRERTYAGKDAQPFPGCGGMVAPIEWCSGRSVDYVVGKPNARMIEITCEMAGCDPSRAVMVGDTYESDMVMAQAAGSGCVLVGDAHGRDVAAVKSIAHIACAVVQHAG